MANNSAGTPENERRVFGRFHRANEPEDIGSLVVEKQHARGWTTFALTLPLSVPPATTVLTVVGDRSEASAQLVAPTRTAKAAVLSDGAAPTK